MSTRLSKQMQIFEGCFSKFVKSNQIKLKTEAAPAELKLEPELSFDEPGSADEANETDVSTHGGL